MRQLCILVLAVSALAAPLRAGAQAQQPSAVIAEIHQAGSTRFADAQVAAASGLQPGDAVTRDQLQLAADRLAQLGIFSKVNYSFTISGDKANKIVLQFQLADAPLVPVTFDNLPWFTDEELSATIRQQLPFFDGGAPKDGALLDTISAAVSQLLEARGISGRLQRSVLARPENNDMTVQFHLDGPTPTIASLEYGDTLARTSSNLAERKNDLLNKPFSRFSIELFEFEQIRPLYLSTGNLRVNFAAPVAHITGNPSPAPAANVSVQLPIDPGPVYHLSKLNWDGNRALDTTALSALATVQPGELADGMKLQDLWQRVENEYSHNGYIDAHVEAQPQFDDAAATVSYRVAITEGPQYHMGGLVLTGLSPAAEGALRAAWQLAPEKVFDGTYVNNMFARLEKPSSQIFGSIPLHYEKMGHFLRINEPAHTVDVLIDFQ
jgi:outer membrane protein assembly factor BamA